MLGNIFFEKFTGRFPTAEALLVAKKIWSVKLKYISDHQIKYALEQCEKWSHDFAPNLPQFIEMCHQAPRERNYSALEHMRAPVYSNVKTAESHIDKLRQILGMKPKYLVGKA